jgi:multidrug efflux pump subunit AcrA (membrane-fusion protein)
MTRPLPAPALALALALALGCEPTAVAPRVAPPAASPVRWVRASPAEGDAVWEAPGVARVEGAGSGEVTAAVRVRVVRIVAQPGDRVAAGDPVVEAEAPEIVRALAARAAAAGRAAPLRRWRAELATQRETGLVRGAELHEVETRLAEAEAELRRAEAELRAAGLPPADLAALERTGRVALRAPVAGVVRAVNVVHGRIVEPGQGALAEVAGAGRARVEVRALHPWPRGATLRFVRPAGESVDLDPAPLAEVLDPSTGGRIVWLRVTGETPLPAGAAGRVVVAGLPRDAAAVPAAAILRGEGGAWVFRRAGGAVRRAAVEVLAVGPSRAVLRGVSVGDEVAAEADLVAEPR